MLNATIYIKKRGHILVFGDKYIKISERLHKKETRETCPSNGHKNNV